jgi:hypothetical protein
VPRLKAQLNGNCRKPLQGEEIPRLFRGTEKKQRKGHSQKLKFLEGLRIVRELYFSKQFYCFFSYYPGPEENP